MNFSNEEIVKQTLNELTPFPKEIFSAVSEQCRDCIDRLLQKEVTNRLNIKELLSHPWISKYSI